MKDYILSRLQELSTEIESLLEERQDRVKRLKKLDSRIKEISILIPELKIILDKHNHQADIDFDVKKPGKDQGSIDLG